MAIRKLAAALAALSVLLSAAPLAHAEKKSKPAAKTEEKKKDEGPLKAETFSGLELRGIGPAVTSGRVSDIAVQPTRRNVWYVAAASGGVWKTVNAGTTWTPVFDGEGSFSIGCLAIDPRNPLIVWVGSGENNSQRSVSYGDGVYKSVDGGKSWQNVGLKASEHIGKILVDPRSSDVVYVAAQGPLWADGGDRGLYKTTDGGKTWKKVLEISDKTGVSDLAFDPRNPDVVYATAYQRRRHVFTLIDGGPEGGIYKSTDAGATWKKLEAGLPKGDVGRIGLAVAPSNPDTVYAIVEAADKASGIYRSQDAGANWEKVSDYMSTSGQYYQELIADPKDERRVYSMDTWMMVTEDGGKSWHKVGEKSKHVDNHALVVDPDDTRHLVAGCDGGVYESYDRGATWDFKANLPVTQFYKLAVDNSLPFYFVYGGTQDNESLGGPSRTTNENGILNSDWFVTVGGDGFQSQVDPEDPNIVYSEWQYGGLIRFDRRSGEVLDIQPQPGKGEPPLRWNWDSPLVISPHAHTRLYFAANRIFRSDDRGDTWKAISPDLTRQLDRNKLKIMGRVWSVDAVAKNASTSFYGNLVALSESPLKEGLLYAGSDDGLIQVTEDGGATWRRIEKFPGVPEMTYVSRVTASRHDVDTVYAAFDNHKNGDFKPYVLKSADRGKSWTSVTGDLPERGSVWCVIEDSKDRNLLFAGTEFGAFFSPDGGKKWIELKGGMPPIAVHDIAVQAREDDLVLATFGRGFYVLDDLSPLRGITEDALKKDALLFPVRPALMYIPSSPIGGRGKGFLGDQLFVAPNPPFGAVFTYYLKDEIKTLKAKRQDAEKEINKKGGDVEFPSWDALRAEDREEEPAVVLTVTDEDGSVVRRLTGPVSSGFHRVAWDLRYPPADPAEAKPPSDEDEQAPIGPLAAPGKYSVSIAKRVNGGVTPLAGPVAFTAVTLANTTIPAQDRPALLAQERRTARLQRAVLGAIRAADEAQTHINLLKKALLDTPSAAPRLQDDLRSIETRLKDLRLDLEGDPTRARRDEPVAPTIVDRVQRAVYGQWTTTSPPTDTHRREYDVAASEFAELLPKLRQLVTVDLKRVEDEAERSGAPWTPGRFPDWRPE